MKLFEKDVLTLEDHYFLRNLMVIGFGSFLGLAGLNYLRKELTH